MSSLSSRAPVKRKSRGRQKVNMVKMTNPSNLQVTFSKRRAGLFKKASELCTLSGAESAIIVFSPANKVYCFGHPNAKTVLDKISGENPNNNVVQHQSTTTGSNVAASQLLMEAHRNSTLRELNFELTQVESFLRAEKRHGEELEMIRKAGEMQRWFPGSLDKFNFEQLSMLKEAIMGFQKSFDEKMQRDMINLNNLFMLPIPYANVDQEENPNGNLWMFEGFSDPRPPLLGSYNEYSHWGCESLGFVDNGPYANDGEDGMFMTMGGNPIDQTRMFFLDEGRTSSSKLSVANGVENEIDFRASCGLNLFG